MADTDPFDTETLATDTVASTKEARQHNYTWAWLLASLASGMAIVVIWIALAQYDAAPPSEYLPQDNPALAPLAMPEEPTTPTPTPPAD